MCHHPGHARTDLPHVQRVNGTRSGTSFLNPYLVKVLIDVLLDLKISSGAAKLLRKIPQYAKESNYHVSQCEFKIFAVVNGILQARA